MGWGRAVLQPARSLTAEQWQGLGGDNVFRVNLGLPKHIHYWGGA